jgi:acyl-CoA synthetase (AMP-forming)/AMP-acid ligase II
VSFLREPIRWLRAITQYKGTFGGAPNFAYDHCVRLVSEEEKQDLDLSSWVTVFNTAEPVRAETLDRFAQAFAGCGFRREALFPGYGLAETWS